MSYSLTITEDMSPGKGGDIFKLCITLSGTLLDGFPVSIGISVFFLILNGVMLDDLIGVIIEFGIGVGIGVSIAVVAIGTFGTAVTTGPFGVLIVVLATVVTIGTAATVDTFGYWYCCYNWSL